MKLFLLIPYIASLINSSPILNQNNQANGTDFGSVDNNLKQCYQCNFPIDDFTNASRLFNDNCINQIVTCNNNLCGSSLVKNQINGNYTIKLGCALDNNCPEVIDEDTEYPEKTEDNYIHCCDDSNLCNNYTTIKNILPFDLGNNSYFTNDSAPFNQTINTQEAVSNLLHDFYLPDNYLDKSCIHKTIFTNENNLIITFKKDSCYKNPVLLLPEDNLPAFPSQPLVKIALLDSKTKMIHDLISSDTFITNVNYIKKKNLLFFIADNSVFVYKLDENNHQLQKISQLYLTYNPVDITINYDAKTLTIASKNILYFYNIENIEQKKQLTVTTKQFLETNIFQVKYASNRNTLLINSYDKDRIYVQIYSLLKYNKIKLIQSSKIQHRDPLKINLENIKYNPYKLNFYYGKFAISPVDNFIVTYYMTDKNINYGYLSDSSPYDTDHYRLTVFCAYYWDAQSSRHYYKKMRILCMDKGYGPLYTFPYKMLLDYFFTTDNKPIIAFIVIKNKKQRNLLLKNITPKSYLQRLYDYESYLEKAYKQKNKKNLGNYYRKKTKEFIAIKQIFNDAHSGIFNTNSSKIAVFSNNRIQIYAMNLDKDAQPKTTTKTPTTKNIKRKKQTTSLPTTQTTNLPTSQSTSTKKQTTSSIITTQNSELEMQATISELANSSSTTNTSYTSINKEKNNNLQTKQNNIIQKNIFFYISIAT